MLWAMCVRLRLVRLRTCPLHLQVCLQIAYIWVPVASAITALTEAVYAYLAQVGYAGSAPAAAAAAGPALPQKLPTAPGVVGSKAPDALATAREAVLTPEHLASAWEAAANGTSASAPLPGAEALPVFDGKPHDYLTPWLPRAMFDHIACLVSIGVRMDEIAQSHGIERLRALDVIKHQVRHSKALLANQLAQASAGVLVSMTWLQSLVSIHAALGQCRSCLRVNFQGSRHMCWYPALACRWVVL